MSLALDVTQTVLSREQRLSALGALAAAAAHELGTPLATISIVAKEMAREAKTQEVKDDAELLISQAERCREILKRLGETPDKATDAMHERLSLRRLVQEVLEPHSEVQGVRLEAIVTGANTGIGQGIAVALAGAGADVALVGRSPAEETADRIKALGRRATLIAADLSTIAPVQRVIDGIPEPMLHRVVARPLDVEGATARIEALLADPDRTEFNWREALGLRPTIVDVLSTFLALLELAKRGLLTLHQPAQFADMVIRRDTPSTVD